MSNGIPVHVGIVNKSAAVSATELEQLIGALNEQVTADFAPAWGVRATVSSYDAQASSGHLPLWKIFLQDTIDQPGAAGYHADQHRQPYAIVDVADGDWTVTTSHELLEMLGDPFGSRMHAAAPPMPGDNSPFASRVHYLLEVCDPCETVTYEAGGVPVSDFLLPGFYRTAARAGIASSHTGAITRPRLILPGGYVSFQDPKTGHWWQRFVDEQGNVTDNDLGLPTGALSLREWVDQAAREHRATHGR